MRKILPFVFIFFFFIFAYPSYASKSYESSYDVLYKILEDGTAHSSFTVDLTNKTSKTYTTSYKLTLGFADIYNIKASDPDGIIIPVVTKENNAYTISLVFNKKVAGIGKKLRFNVSFDTKDIVQKNGNILEVNIPGISNQNDFSSFNVTVEVPKSFGEPTYIKPDQPTQSLKFNKKQLGKSGISIAFGDYQVYKFDLLYHLKNTNLFPINTEIALPPSTNYQKVAIEDITPKPIDVTLDFDGNWLAKYSLKPGEKKDIKVKGKAKVSLYPKKQSLTKKEREEYLKEKPYWQLSNNKIQELAQKLKTPYAIYQFVSEKLAYDFSRVTSSKPRIGAALLLDKPESSVCLEFTDLFVALSRAAGIPARSVEGFAYTENPKQRPISIVKDILHVWPEYYDDKKETWVMVDPTWGNTTKGIDYFNVLDFDHLTFVIKGQNSTYPIPAGGYKISGVNTKDVNISFDKEFEDPKDSLELTINISEFAISGFFTSGEIAVKNTGGNLVSSEDIIIRSTTLSPKIQKKTIKDLPPYGTQKIKFTMESTNFDYDKEASIMIDVRGKTIERKISFKPFYKTPIGIGGGIFVIFFTIIILIITARARYIFIPRQK